MTIVKLIFCFLLPPLAAFMQVGFSAQFWINLLLTIVTLYTLGIIHALWLVLSDKQA